MDHLRIGIVGAGAIAQRNASEAVRSGASRVMGVFDVNAKVARDMARALSVPYFPTYEELLRNSDIEAVLISVPHHLHRPLSIQAADAGKHVMVEKPIANNLEEADSMLSACRRNGVKLTVNYSFRYLPRVRKARALVEAGALGSITGVQILLHQYKDPGYWTGARSNSPDDWRASKAKCGGGFLIMNACHVTDYLAYITGLKVRRVYSEYATLGSPAEVEDIVSISYRFDNGAIGSLSASSIMRGVDQAEERIWGTNGTIVMDSGGLHVYSTRPIDGLRPGKVHHLKKFPETSWTAEWVTGFARAIRENTTPEISGREAWENLAFISTAYRSLEDGKVLEVPCFSDEADS
ncbi:MAG: gfo/Idh/MocA family oxidoreductase [Deltaproteobacteria bacterium]|nr:MAG: gfo/Idh/MocA family oxidoreductase [Deltaproteobacteria bacterium]